MNEMKVRTFLLVVVIAAAILFVLGMADKSQAQANGPTVVEWVEDMNHESYWEAEFGVECTKFENHGGYIPADYDYVLVKAGQHVTIFQDVAAGTTVGAHDGKDISWVMKCKGQPTTTTTTVVTTTTVPPTTTTSVAETTTTVENTTTTTTPPPSSTTTVGSSTTTSTTPATTSTTVPVSTSTSMSPPVEPPVEPPTEPPTELPYTGLPVWLLLVAATGLVGGGVGLVKRGALNE